MNNEIAHTAPHTMEPQGCLTQTSSGIWVPKYYFPKELEEKKVVEWDFPTNEKEFKEFVKYTKKNLKKPDEILREIKFSEGVVKLSMDGRTVMTAAEGNGPVNAFDIALKKALESYYPELSEVSLTGYRVREINVEKGTAAAVQVFIEFKAKRERWSTVGVSANILEASEEALIAGYLYYLYKQREKSKSK